MKIIAVVAPWVALAIVAAFSPDPEAIMFVALAALVASVEIAKRT